MIVTLITMTSFVYALRLPLSYGTFRQSARAFIRPLVRIIPLSLLYNFSLLSANDKQRREQNYSRNTFQSSCSEEINHSISLVSILINTQYQRSCVFAKLPLLTYIATHRLAIGIPSDVENVSVLYISCLSVSVMDDINYGTIFFYSRAGRLLWKYIPGQYSVSK